MKRILIVDDSVVLRNDIRKLIKPIERLEIVGEAVDAENALRLVETLNPDIMILDINLKDSNGIEVLKKIKKTSPLPITIMFTNYAKSEFQERAKRLGADYFFDKTKDIEALLSTLTKLE